MGSRDVRFREVTVDANALAAALIPDVQAVPSRDLTEVGGGSLEWRLLDGSVVALEPDETSWQSVPLMDADLHMSAWADVVYWTGETAKDSKVSARATLAMSRTPGSDWIVSGGLIETPDSAEQVFGYGDGRVEIQDAVEDGVPDSAVIDVDVKDIDPGSASATTSDRSDGAVALAITPVTIDILGVATAGDPFNFVQLNDALAFYSWQVAYTNYTMQNSDSPSANTGAVTVALAGIVGVNYVPSPSIATDWYWLQANSTTNAARQLVGADIVSLVRYTRPSDGCGVAAQPYNGYVGNPAYGYNVLVRERSSECSGRYVLAHELGHNLGAGHYAGDFAPGRYSDSLGYVRFSAPTARDVMSEDHGCNCARRTNYSNPERNFYGTSVASGDWARFNARTVAVSAGEVADNYSRPVRGGTTFQAVAPVRIVDSRAPNAVGGYMTPWSAGETRQVSIAGALGVVPASATAVLANITVTSTGGAGWMRAYGYGQSVPATSVTNWIGGRDRASTAVIPIGDLGLIEVYTTTSTHVLIDVYGYFGGPSSGAKVGTVTPVRALDTRPGAKVSGGASLPVALAGGYGIPSNATAAIVNVTVTNPEGAGYLVASNSSNPYANGTSILNFATDQVISNFAIVPMSGGTIYLGTSVNAHMIVDVLGFVGPTGALNYTPINPVRLWASTQGPNQTINVQITNNQGIPSNATAVLVNVTGNVPNAWTYLTAYPAGLSLPNVSTTNLSDGSPNANHAVVPVGANGQISLFNAFGTLWTYVDIEGYFTS